MQLRSFKFPSHKLLTGRGAVRCQDFFAKFWSEAVLQIAAELITHQVTHSKIHKVLFCYDMLFDIVRLSTLQNTTTHSLVLLDIS